ncbi:hypothetical protein [Pasteuria penetrans]|uniref:hypothetical protein n=1 Tax=Pasteuria penetrans TaxID=86005 RepID=UPI0011ED345E|nr:hypothetical protein [Pasteuria penetrans]
MTVSPSTLAQSSFSPESVPHGSETTGEGRKIESNDSSVDKGHERDQGDRETGEWKVGDPNRAGKVSMSERIYEWLLSQEGYDPDEAIDFEIVKSSKNDDGGRGFGRVGKGTRVYDICVQLTDRSLRIFRFIDHPVLELVDVWKRNPGDREWTLLTVRNGDGGVPRSRSIRVVAYADPSYRENHPKWEEDIRMFFSEISKRFYKAIGVRIEVVHVQELKKELILEKRFAYLRYVQENPSPSFAHIKVAFTGRQGKYGSGSDVFSTFGQATVGWLGRSLKKLGPLASIVRVGHPSEKGTSSDEKEYNDRWYMNLGTIEHELTHNLGEEHIGDDDRDCKFDGLRSNVMCPGLGYASFSPGGTYWSPDQIQRMKAMVRDWRIVY